MTLTRKKPQLEYRNIFLALLAGAGAGLTVGLLMAPNSGHNLRARIGGAVSDSLDSASQKAEESRDAATKLAQRGLREVRKATGNATEAVRSAIGS